MWLIVYDQQSIYSALICFSFYNKDAKTENGGRCVLKIGIDIDGELIQSARKQPHFLLPQKHLFQLACLGGDDLIRHASLS